MPGQGGEGGKPGPKMSDAARWLRDAAIVAELHAGARVIDVAKANDLTAGQVRRVLRSWNARPTALEKAPMEIVERMLRTYEELLLSYAKVAAETMDRQPAVAVAALRSRGETHERYVQLLGYLGKLPSNLEMFRAEDELRRIAERISEMLDAATRGEVSPADVRAELDKLIGLRPRFDADGEVAGELDGGETAEDV